MNIKIFATASVLLMMSASTYVGSCYASSTIPQNVTAVYPQPDSRIDIGPNASPLGVQQISVMFNKNVSVNSDCKGEACIYAEGEETPLQTVGISGVSVDLTQPKMGCVLFPYSCKKNGNYRVTIPEGFWILDGASTSGALDLYYEILNPQRITPSEPVVKELSEFRLEFPGYQKAKLVNANKIELFKHSSPDTYPITVTEGKNADGTPANYIQITLNTPITEQGEYSLFVQAGAAEGIPYEGSGDQTEPNIEALYRYTISQIDAPGIMPEEGLIESFNSFELTVPDGAEFWFVNDRAVSFIYPVNEDGSLGPDAVYRLTGSRVEDSDKILLTISENGESDVAVTPAPGKYALQLASGLFSGSWNGDFINSAPFVYYYEAVGDPTGVDKPSLTKDNDVKLKGIYSIEGKKILDCSNSQKINNLPDGIYIIDGKKTYVSGK